MHRTSLSGFSVKIHNWVFIEVVVEVFIYVNFVLKMKKRY